MHKHIKLKPDGVGLVGRVEARGYDARYIKTYKDVLVARNRGLIDKVTIWKDVGDNRIVDVGVQQIIDLFLGSNVNYPTYCQNGTSSTAVTAADTALGAATGSRIAINYKYRSSLSAKFDTFFATADENATWAESALFTAVTGGIMLCRKIYGSTFVKSTSNTATVTWTWTLAPQ